jgi:hypothetical protein
MIPKKRRHQESALWAEGHIQALGAPMQIMDYPRVIPGLVERRTGIDVPHSVTHGVVEHDCDLAHRGGDCLGLADTRREPPVECAERGVGVTCDQRLRQQAGEVPQRGSRNGAFAMRAFCPRRSCCSAPSPASR